MFKTTLITILLCSTLSAFSTVKEIRAEYKIIHDAIKKNLYKIKSKSTKDFTSPSFSKTIYFNDKGMVKQLSEERDSEDSSHSKLYFYTNEGNLFFTYESSGDAHNGSIEIRRYYNDQMELIKEIVTPPLKKGDDSISSCFPEIIKDSKEALKYFEVEFPK